ncbi:hypothetical protein CN692_19155 [Bacillus sp. AFS002410]|uniref:hypothetical protein n=1 Tax=Bacillus sp. AFS002410 TaxID=2033481 RepID=UPI000BEF3C94|nr:hypothetical protein [Bacillus sp. AFS002410]PEJ56081.1 hypothetical protein CN692_19155 [Bacillus sp. AFS002410]
METCLYPGCGYKADFISKAHCRSVHEMEREEIEKKYGKSIGVKKRSKMSLQKWVPTQKQIDRAAGFGIGENTLRARGKLGWDVESAIITPIYSPEEVAQNGVGKFEFNINKGAKK